MEHMIIMSLVVSLVAVLPHVYSHNNHQNNTQCHASNPLIEKACAKSLYKEFCIQNLNSSHTNGTSDMKSIAFTSINTTKTHGSVVRSWLAPKLKDSNLSSDVKPALSECSEYYSGALEDLKRAIDSFQTSKTYNDRFFNDLNAFVSGAMSSAVHCEDKIDKKSNANDVMKNHNKLFKQYCSNALAVTVFWSKIH